MNVNEAPGERLRTSTMGAPMTSSSVPDAPLPGHPQGPVGRSVVWHLVLYGAAMLLPLLLAGSYLFWQGAREEQRRIDEGVRGVALTIAQDLDREVAHIQAMLRSLASAPSLQVSGSGTFETLAQATARNLGVGIILRDAEGQVSANTQAAAGNPPVLPLDGRQRRVIETGEASISGLLRDAPSAGPHVLVTAPVPGSDGRPAGLIEAVMAPERFRAILARHLPDQIWAACFMDRDGLFVARTRNPESSVGVAATQQLRNAARGASGTWVGRSHEGNPILGGFALSAETGWYVAVAVDKGAVNAPLQRSMTRMAAMLALATALSLLLAYLFGRRIARPILGLAALARAPGPGEDRGALPALTDLREVNSVGCALARAGHALRQRARELEESERHFRSFVELNPQMPWTADPSGRLLEVSERWGLFTGMSVEEALGEGWQNAQHPDDRAMVALLWRRSVESGAPFDVEHRVQDAGGSFRWMRTRAFPRRDANGVIQRWYGATEDIDESRRSRDALAASEERLHVGLAVSGVGILEFDYTADTVRLDARAGDIFGLPVGETLPRAALHARFHPDDKPGLLARIAVLLGPEGEGFLAAEYRIVLPDGMVRWVLGRHKVDYVAGPDGVRRAGRSVLAVLDITARKRDEERIAAGFEEIQAIYDTAPVGLCVIDRDLRFVRINERMAEINGLPAADHIGRRLHDILPGLVDPAEAALAQILATGETLRGIEIVGETLAQPGVTRAWIEEWRPLRDGAGEIYAVSVVAEEVTQRRQAEAAIFAAAAQFRAAAGAVPGLMWVANASGSNTFVNDSFCLYTGLPREALLGDGWRRTFHPQDFAANADKWAEAARTRSVFEAEYRFRRHDGAWRWHLGRSIPQLDDAGEIVQWVGIATDIDDIRRARETLERNQAELERRVGEATAERNEIWRLTPDLLGVASREGRWISVNPAWTNVLGHEAADILAMEPDELIHPDDLMEARAIRDALNDGMNVGGTELRLRAKDGSWRHIAWTAVAPDGAIYAVGRDVTDAKAAAERLREAQEALSQTQKMETIGQLTGGVAHDFNNLLAAILSNLDLARKRIGADKKALSLVEGAIQGAERGAALTQRLLAFARRQELKAQRVDVAALLGGMKELLSRSLGPSIRLEVKSAKGLPAAHVDPNQLELALLNLAVNARDAMPEGGVLTIAAASQQVAAGNSERLLPGDYVRLEIQDTGVGMDEETLRRAVEPFFTTKELGQGTGLGLSMVQGLVAQSGGAFLLASRPGEGSTATLILPVAKGAAEAVKPPSLRLPDSARPLTVLVVDDDPLVAMGHVAMLEDLGHAVIEASSGREALELLEANPGVQVVITDQAMPGMTGAELAERIRELRPGLPIILATGGIGPGQSPAEMRVQLPRLSKPFRQSDLALALARALPPLAP